MFQFFHGWRRKAALLLLTSCIVFLAMRASAVYKGRTIRSHTKAYEERVRSEETEKH